MKLLATSDWHGDASTAGFSRYNDIEIAVAETVRTAVDEKVDLYLFLGDLCDPDQRSHRCVGLAAETAVYLWKKGIPNYWLVGNHDVIEDGSGTSTLSGMAHLAEIDEHLAVIDRPRRWVQHGVSFVALPYTPRSHPYDPAEWVRSNPCLGSTRVVVLGHLNIEGIEPGSETSEMPRGRDVFFPLEACRETYGNRALLLNGHYHARQEYDGIHIPGSLERLTFGEEKNDPGYLLIEIPRDPWLA